MAPSSSSRSTAANPSGSPQRTQLPLTGGEAQALTDGQAGVETYVPLPDGRTIAYEDCRRDVEVRFGPAFVQRLFAEHGEQLKEYGGIRKIFYAGEHFGAQAIARLRVGLKSN